ncbi:MAG: hypothetical protein U0228_27730 [Myxococcaceae bacterium]
MALRDLTGAGGLISDLRDALLAHDALRACDLAAELQRRVVDGREAIDAATRAAIAECDRLAVAFRAELERALRTSAVSDRAARAYAGDAP